MNGQVDVSTLVLETPRLILRPFKVEDYKDVFDYASDKDVGPMAGWEPHKTLDDSKLIVDMFIQEKKVLAIEYKNKVIGSIGLEELSHDPYPSHLGREIGFVIGKEYWGQGLTLEALTEVVRYCFDVLNFEYLIANHYDFNHQSKRVIEKCGFKFLETEVLSSKIHGDIKVMRYVKLR
jgi:ribosomal-protein-alanine N-acetyltransferase